MKVHIKFIKAFGVLLIAALLFAAAPKQAQAQAQSEEEILALVNASKLNTEPSIGALLVTHFGYPNATPALEETVALFWFNNYDYQQHFHFATYADVQTAAETSLAEYADLVAALDGNTSIYPSKVAAVESFMAAALRLAGTSESDPKPGLGYEIEELAPFLTAGVITPEGKVAASYVGLANSITGETSLLGYITTFGQASLAGKKVHNITQGTYYATIQGAIDAAAEGSTIYVAAGTYNEVLTVNKPLSLIGAGVGETIIDGTDLSSDTVLTATGIASGELNISGFTIQGYPDTPHEKKNVHLVAIKECKEPAKINFTNNKLIGKGPSDDDFGIIAGYNGSCETVINHNEFENIGGNTILLELATGPVEVGYNILKLPVTIAPGITSFSYGTETNPNTVTGKHWYHNNHITSMNGNEIRTGIDVEPGRKGNYPAESSDYGAYVDVLIEENVIENYNNVGINIKGHGPNSSFNGVIRNNTMTQIYNRQGTGIWLNGNVKDTIVSGNTVTNSTRGMLIYNLPSSLPEPENITIEKNNFAGNTEGLWDNGTVKQVITVNWWGSATGPAAGYINDNENYTPWCGDAYCSFLVSDDVTVLSGTITNTTQLTAGQTVLLLDGTVIDPTSGPCFEITGSNVKIMTESPLGAVCKPGSPGITVAAGTTNIIIEGLEIDGTAATAGDGIEFLGGVTDVIIRDTFIHDMKGDGVHFTNQPAGYVEIKGNLFMDNTGFGVNAPGDLDVKYNAWGAYDGPTATDLPAAITNFDPWTHVDVFVEYVAGTRYINEVALADETITYAVKANLKQAFGAEFTLTFDPTYLEVKNTTLGSVFTLAESMQAIVVDDVAGTITFAAGSFEEKSGQDQLLYTVEFKPVATTPETPLNPLEIRGKQGVSLFGMNPGYGSSLNIYPVKLLGVDHVNVYMLPELAADPLTGYDVGNPKEFILTVTNPDGPDGRDYTDAKVCLDVPTGAVLEYWNGTEWVVYTPCFEIGKLDAGDKVDILFRITFPEAGTIDIPVKLYDGTILLVKETFKFEVTGAHAFTGSVQMQGRTVRAGVLFKLVGPYTYQTFSTAPISDNVSFANVAGGSYALTITHDRYLSLIDYALTIDANTPNWGRFELKGGDLDDDQKITIYDASIIGSNYGATGDNAGDANFDSKVNIQDLAMVGGNFDLQSHSPAGGNYAYPAVPTWAP